MGMRHTSRERSKVQISHLYLLVLALELLTQTSVAGLVSTKQTQTSLALSLCIGVFRELVLAKG